MAIDLIETLMRKSGDDVTIQRYHEIRDILAQYNYIVQPLSPTEAQLVEHEYPTQSVSTSAGHPFVPLSLERLGRYVASQSRTPSPLAE